MKKKVAPLQAAKAAPTAPVSKVTTGSKWSKWLNLASTLLQAIASIFSKKI